MINKILIIASLDEKVIGKLSYKWSRDKYRIEYNFSISESKLTQSIENYRAIIVESHNIIRDLNVQWRVNLPAEKLVSDGLNSIDLDTEPNEKSFFENYVTLVQHDNQYLNTLSSTTSIEFKNDLSDQDFWIIFWYSEEVKIVDEII